jgi:GNAT superfamily N-acetyltransferase
VGRRWGVCAELQQLWVKPELRRQGHGARLVRAFEAQAARCGCRTLYLETFSFQAPRLYASLGYEMRHTIEGFGHGIAKHLMVHHLTP